MSEARRRPGPVRKTNFEAVVEAYRKPRATYKSVGSQFGISHVMVWKIVKGLAPELMQSFGKVRPRLRLRRVKEKA